MGLVGDDEEPAAPDRCHDQHVRPFRDEAYANDHDYSASRRRTAFRTGSMKSGSCPLRAAATRCVGASHGSPAWTWGFGAYWMESWAFSAKAFPSRPFSAAIFSTNSRARSSD